MANYYNLRRKLYTRIERFFHTRESAKASNNPLPEWQDFYVSLKKDGFTRGMIKEIVEDLTNGSLNNKGALIDAEGNEYTE